MPTLVFDLAINGLASETDVSIDSLTIDNTVVTITDKDVTIVDSGHAELEVTYTTT